MSRLVSPRAGTVQAKVLDYLNTGHSLTIPQSQALFGYIMLPGAVFRLRSKGYPIVSTTITGPNNNKLTFYKRIKAGDKVRIAGRSGEGTVVGTVPVTYGPPLVLVETSTAWRTHYNLSDLEAA